MKSTDNTTIFARSFRDRYYYAPWEIVIQGWTSGCPVREEQKFIIHSIERDGDRETGITSELSSAIGRRRGFQRRARSPFFDV